MTLTKTLHTTFAAAGMAVSALVAAPAVAQDTNAANGDEAAAAADVSAVELDAFVAAVDAVMSIEQTYAARLDEAEGDQAQQQQLMEEARTEMMAAVNETPDIDVDRYVEIIELAQNDPELRADLTDRMEN
ncbi:DUF4168 domain-containing protein [Salibaculum sp.]|uniref:DUF4168 domain-containing protein n=1 Tax=Salibaculum sp. TaxID=2855480 RepID=UPI002B49CC42|nr:DUF4168 domain-containing protein [Salibaculum sp.]HKL69823.1 DUF4168 domain-containing protein [Salibaculum sp.]